MLFPWSPPLPGSIIAPCEATKPGPVFVGALTAGDGDTSSLTLCPPPAKGRAALSPSEHRNLLVSAEVLIRGWEPGQRTGRTHQEPPTFIWEFPNRRTGQRGDGWGNQQ